ncbi:hypothetical protein C8R46DRAFT_1257669 [Mycena filopes]|nr:hypothetical protein C8R46DRAFT_1298220 [Mycena filopes]KAJ7171999.1 hypothetical protein C8R46DRAFT_1257669 [Mycena filopes]
MPGLKPPPSTDPFLPLELEREIFETAALSSSTRLTLLRVSRRVLVWIEPLLYRVLRVDSPVTAAAIERAMQRKPPEFFSSSVRSLYLSKHSSWAFQTACALVQLCPNLVSLFFDSGWPEPSLLQVLDGMSGVRMWHGSLRRLFGDDPVDLGHPFFRTITHMNFTYTPRLGVVVPSIVAIPALTHLALDAGSSLRDTVSLPGILEQSPRLQILLVRGRPRAIITDVRCVAFTGRIQWDDWVARGHDIWAQAEAFVAQKRRGEIDVSALWTGLL